MLLLPPAKIATLSIKIIRWMFIWLAIRVSTKLHESLYVEQVYGKKEPPPGFYPLITNIATFLAIFHVAILSLVNSMVVAGVFPKSVITYALTESVFYTIFIIMTAALLSSLVATKRYFNYKKDGIRAIRAYKEMMIWIIIPISVSPIFFTT